MSLLKWTLKNLGNGSFQQLEKDVKGWEQLKVRLYRSERYHGVFFAPSQTQLTFLSNGGGKEFIDTVYRTEDINGNIELTCHYTAANGILKVLFRAKINLASYVSENNRVTVSIEQSDLYQKLFARDQINVNLESPLSIGQKNISTVNPRNVILPGQMVKFQSESQVKDEHTNSFSSMAYSITENKIQGFATIDWNTKNTELPQYNGWNDFDEWGLSGALTPSSANIQPVLMMTSKEVSYPVTVNPIIAIKGNVSIVPSDFGPTRQGHIRLVVAWGPTYGQAISSGNTVQLFIGNYNTGGPSNRSFDVNFTDPINLNEGDGIWVAWTMQSQIFSGSVFMNETYNFTFTDDNAYGRNFLQFTSDTMFNDTETKSVMLHEAFNQIADAMADSNGNFYSELYGRPDSKKITYPTHGEQCAIAITDGLNIRGKEKALTLNMKDTFESANALHNIGLSIVKGKIRVEKKEWFYKTNDRLIQLPNVAKIKTSNDNSRYVNQIEIGYDKWETEYRQGLDDIHGKHEYSTKVAPVKAAYSQMSKYISSSYAIEVTRRKRGLQETQDWQYDNDNFWLALTNQVYVQAFDNGPGYDDMFILYGVAFKFEAGQTITIRRSNGSVQTYNINGSALSVGDTVIYVSQSLSNSSLELVTVDNYGCEKYPFAFSNGNGMISMHTAFNPRLTASRMLLAHMNVITSGLQTIKGDVRYIKGDGNTAFEAAKLNRSKQEDFNEVLLKESDSISWNNTNANNIKPLWMPEYYEFEYPLHQDEFERLQINPHGYIEAWETPTDIKRGYILDMAYRVKDGLTDFKLLRKNA